MRLVLNLSEKKEAIAEAVARDLASFFAGPHSRRFLPLQVELQNGKKAERRFEVEVELDDALVIGFDDCEFDAGDVEHPDCPEIPATWCANSAFVKVELVNKIGVWVELSEWPWTEGYIEEGIIEAHLEEAEAA